MKIKYVYRYTPDQEKIFDTVEAYKKLPEWDTTTTQKDFDNITLAEMQKEKDIGIILRYEVIEP